MRFECVLAKKYTAPVTTVPVYTASIKDKSLTKSILDILKESHPIDQSLRHLKRIRSHDGHLEVIITQQAKIDDITILEKDEEAHKEGHNFF